MGLLDSLNYGNQGGYGGLLDALMYRSPLNQQPALPQPQYDPMGAYTGVTQQNAPDPFGPPPQLAQWAQQFAPKSPFTAQAPATPIPFAAGPSAQPQQPTAPQTPADNGQVNDALVGGYSMPRIGSVADFTPQPGATDFSGQSRTAAQPQQPMQQPAQALPPAFGGGGYMDRLNNGGGIVSSLFGDNSQQRNLRAQFDALVPLVGPQKAMLAVMNPEAGKTILAQALEKKQYGFHKLDNDTMLRTDPMTGKAEVAYGGGDERGSITGPDGKPIAIPAGVDRKTFVNEVSRANAKAAAGEKTEVQAKSEIFANKMELSNKQIVDGTGTSLAGKIASGIPLGNYVQTPEYQKYKQASSNFITALLRQESGAAINKAEFERYDKEYMPQPGDGPDVLAQKTEARRIAIEGMKKGAGPGYKSPTAAPLPSGWSVQVR